MKRIDQFWPYGVALLIGAAVFFRLYDWSFVMGRSGFFSHGDVSQAVAGWWMYARDGWHFPVFLTEHLMWPMGESIVFTDSIPFMALLFKPFTRLLPEHFHYIGLWHLLVYLIQPVSAVFLVRSLGAPKWSSVFAAFFAVTFPALTWRVGHSSLMMHAIILCSLGLYFSALRGCIGLRAAHVWFYGLQAIALLVHAYFFPMVYVIWLAMMVDMWDANGKLIGVVRRVGVNLVVVAIFFVFFGFLRGGTETVGFGIYSMNLWSPFVGGAYTPQFLDATKGQGEGFNYFGLGGMLLVAFTMLLRGPNTLTGLIRCRGLLVVLSLMAFYALSNHVYAGDKLLWIWPDFMNVKKLTHTFRASGRFFWPMGYAILLTSLAILTVKSKMRQMVPLLLLLAIIQWFDLSPIRARAEAEIKRPLSPVSGNVSSAVAGAKIMGCSPSVIGETAEGNQFVLNMHYLAGYNGLSLCGGYVSHGSQSVPEAGDRADIYIVSKALVESHHDELSSYAKNLVERGVMRSVDGYLMFRKGWTDADWIANVPSSSRYDYLAAWGALEIGATQGPGSALLEFTSGWSLNERKHRWSLGHQSVMRFKSNTKRTVRIKMSFSVLDGQHVVARLNGNEIFSEKFNSMNSPETKLTPPLTLQPGINELKFDLPDAKVPDNGDPRVLGLAFHSLSIE